MENCSVAITLDTAALKETSLFNLIEFSLKPLIFISVSSPVPAPHQSVFLENPAASFLSIKVQLKIWKLLLLFLISLIQVCDNRKYKLLFLPFIKNKTYTSVSFRIETSSLRYIRIYRNVQMKFIVKIQINCFL